jgi:hypothetical protein
MQPQCAVDPMRPPCFAERLLFKKSVSLAYPFADAMIAVSAVVADDLAALSGLRRDDISVVHNPPSSDRRVRPTFAAAETIWRGCPVLPESPNPENDVYRPLLV